MGRYTDPLRTAVVGVGSMGCHHARVYAECPGTELVGVNDVDPERAASVADTCGVPTVSWPDVLEEVDAVSLAVPTQYHHEMARVCIDRGVHVLVEKPFVETAAEGQDLIDRAESAGVVLQVGHIERFNPAVEVASNYVADLDVIGIRGERLNPPVARDILDTAVMDLMIHDIDILFSLVDSPVVDVNAVGARENRHALAEFEFENGVVGHLTASRLTQERVRQLTVTAQECLVRVDYDDQSVSVHRQGEAGTNPRALVERLEVEQNEPLKNELKSFAEAVVTGREPVVTGEDGLRVVECARRIDEMAMRRRRRRKNA